MEPIATAAVAFAILSLLLGVLFKIIGGVLEFVARLLLAAAFVLAASAGGLLVAMEMGMI